MTNNYLIVEAYKVSDVLILGELSFQARSKLYDWPFQIEQIGGWEIYMV